MEVPMGFDEGGIAHAGVDLSRAGRFRFACLVFGARIGLLAGKCRRSALLWRAFGKGDEYPLAAIGLATGDMRVKMDDKERFAAKAILVLRPSILFRVITRMEAASSIKAKPDA